MKKRKAAMVLPPSETHFVGDGFRVHNFFPGNPAIGLKGMDPFILMDYNSPYTFPPSEKPRGVGAHPHKGFETVTIAYKGRVAHHDSSGGGGVIDEGDVQWMTAGRGVLHKEYHEEEWSKKGGEFQMVQIWVNLPRKNKDESPRYQAIKKENFGRHHLPEEAGTVEVIAGDYQGEKGPAFTHSPIHLYNLNLKKGGKAPFHFPGHYSTALLVLHGSIRLNGTREVPADHLVVMTRNEGTDFEIESDETAKVLVLSGEPLDEPIAAQGPFVMNTREELIQAFDDFNRGKFGYLD